MNSYSSLRTQLWYTYPVKTEFLRLSTLQAKVFNKDDFPEPVGPNMAVKHPALI